MGIFADAIHAEYFSREVEPGDLLATVIRGFIGLQGAWADRVHGLEVVTLTVQMLAFLQRFVALDDVV